MTIRFLFIALILFSTSSVFAQKMNDWIVTKTSWSADDEQRFGAFVTALAKAKCSTVNECIRSEANPYRSSDPADVKFWSDCADLPYFLRAYFAWKNQLPFSYVSEVSIRGGRGSDDRYSDGGNDPVARQRIAPTIDGSRKNFLAATDDMQNTVSTAFFRFGPDVDDSGSVMSDFYPVDIDPDFVKPGAVAYSPLGHVSIVYEVTADGRVLLFNAHPADRKKPGSGTPVSRTSFETRKEYVRSRPAHGSGLKQWRPFKLVGAQWKKDRYVGGTFVFSDDSRSPGYSTVQYDGMDSSKPWSKAVFKIGGRAVSYENFIRLRLASQNLDPVVDFERKLTEVCGLLKDRVAAVQGAVDAGLPQTAHPLTIPRNIFSASGAWEDYSSPSRDVRVRSGLSNIRSDLLDQLRAIKDGDSSIVRKAHLRSELLAAYARVAHACSITYRNSKAQPVTLGFTDLVRRISAISFDPYHCPERRWGATGAELASCKESADAKAWYDAEEIIRNYLEKDWKAPSDITLSMLRNGSLGFGRPKASDLDVKSFVERLPEEP